MNRFLLAIGLLSLAALHSNFATASFEPALIQAEVHQSMRNNMCPLAGAATTKQAPSRELVEPFKVFDNLYFVGNSGTSSWALTTDEGIILIDAMFHDNVKETVVAGLTKLGLDPADIKYAIITQGHNDHFGGASYLQKTYGAKIVMSEIDWGHILVSPQMGKAAPLPTEDIKAKNGDVITLGDTRVNLVLTPGHTPGTISPVFSVRDGDKEYKVGYWGGAAMGNLPPEGLRTYIESVQAYKNQNVDLEMTNHPSADGTFLKRDALVNRGKNDPHPFVTGNRNFQAWLDVLIECGNIHLAQKRSKQDD